MDHVIEYADFDAIKIYCSKCLFVTAKKIHSWSKRYHFSRSQLQKLDTFPAQERNKKNATIIKGGKQTNPISIITGIQAVHCCARLHRRPNPHQLNKLNQMMCSHKIYGMNLSQFVLFSLLFTTILLIATAFSDIRWEFEMIKFNRMNLAQQFHETVRRKKVACNKILYFMCSLCFFLFCSLSCSIKISCEC